MRHLGFHLFLLLALFSSLGADLPSNRLSPELAAILRTSPRVILLSIDPQQEMPGGEWRTWHGKIIGQLDLIDPRQRGVAVSTVTDAIKAFDGTTSKCFEPRHALRVTADGKTFDFLICFQCHHLKVFSGNQLIAALHITGSQKPLDELLVGAGIPLPKSPK